MSMRNYAVYDYGLLLDEKTMKFLARKAIDGYTGDDEYDVAYELYERGFGECISGFTGEAIKIDDDGYCSYEESVDYDCDTIFYVPVFKFPTLFSNAYRSMDDLVEEFKDKIGEYLPINFNYKNNIYRICGSYYG